MSRIGRPGSSSALLLAGALGCETLVGIKDVTGPDAADAGDAAPPRAGWCATQRPDASRWMCSDFDESTSATNDGWSNQQSSASGAVAIERDDGAPSAPNDLRATVGPGGPSAANVFYEYGAPISELHCALEWKLDALDDGTGGPFELLALDDGHTASTFVGIEPSRTLVVYDGTTHGGAQVDSTRWNALTFDVWLTPRAPQTSGSYATVMNDGVVVYEGPLASFGAASTATFYVGAVDVAGTKTRWQARFDDVTCSAQ